ncbi:gluconeogenesis factor YvcK family protein [Paenibacillus alkalitolerans]|uniref:gluconeogenesis factor YvcK family protein n=1 Tax=Paenibacillus alkalitolerans TaxID=2799335 RepID=UPI0018F5C0D1|nr:YvcK family protein [Paenibacillus alkalitolerans]
MENTDIAHLGAKLPKVVVIGGGTGLSVMLRGLKQKPIDITAIVTVADDGGSSGRLRDELQMPPPGDIRNVLSALANVEPVLSEMLQYRFSSGTGLAGHTLGNLILAALKDISGDFVSGIKELSRVLAVRGRVLPAAHEAIVLKAEMEDGTIIVGESKIPKAGGRIKRVFIDTPGVTPLPEAIEAIGQADGIVFGPGSLYTSILPNLLVPGIPEAIRAAGAPKVYICNVMTQPGETDGYTVSEHVNALADHVGHGLFQYVIVNNSDIPRNVRSLYAEKGADVVKLDLERLNEMNYRIIADELALFQGVLRHDARKLSDHIYRLVEDGMSKKR